MSLSIRLSRTGRKGKPFYRIVVTPARSKRNGKSIETLGFYNPSLDTNKLELNQEKYQQWLKFGAKPSTGLRKILNEKIA